MKYTYITFPRGYLTGESENSLVFSTEDFDVWVAKKLVKVSDYTLFATLTVGEDFEFTYVDSDEDDDKLGLVELLEILEEYSAVKVKLPKEDEKPKAKSKSAPKAKGKK